MPEELSETVVHRGATEPPFSGRYWDHHEEGTYTCAGCGAVLFLSDDKCDSGSGWPSFLRPGAADAVTLRRDRNHGMERTEERCAGHLGHVLPAVPAPTGLRHCVNSAALEFAG